ncbi:MAG: hypothetical protein WCH39_27085 [Schlesneria sp.]
MFDVIPVSNSQIYIDLGNEQMQRFNSYAIADALRFKAGWRAFWDSTRDVASMQGLLDALASHQVTDPVLGTTDALTCFFAKAQREIARIILEYPTAFADARKDSTGTYTEFLGPGWLWSMSGSRFVVSAPVTWVG